MFDCVKQTAKSKENIASLNLEQGLAHKLILQCVVGNEENGKLFFISVPGGCGKTFLMETILSSILREGANITCVASSGIAAELLEGGCTAHSQFNIPIPISDESMCSISLQFMHVQLMKSTSLICWDEVLMSNKQHLECADRSLWDILKVEKLFGGIMMVFGGDPNHIMPIGCCGDHPLIVNACVKSSQLWSQVCKIKLTQNMRVEKEEVEFVEYLLWIGDGVEEVFPEIGEQVIKIASQFLVHSFEKLISKVFPQIADGYEDKYYIAHQVILTPKNDNVNRINAQVMSLFPGTS